MRVTPDAKTSPPNSSEFEIFRTQFVKELKACDIFDRDLGKTMICSRFHDKEHPLKWRLGGIDGEGCEPFRYASRLEVAKEAIPSIAGIRWSDVDLRWCRNTVPILLLHLRVAVCTRSATACRGACELP